MHNIVINNLYALCYCINLRFNYYTLQWLREVCWEELTNMICHILANEVAFIFITIKILIRKNIQ